MATLTIENLDEVVHAGLRKRADLNERSVEAEAHAILAEKVAPKYRSGQEFYDAVRRGLTESGGFREREFMPPDRPTPSSPLDFSE